MKTGEQMEQLLQKPAPLKYAYTYDAQMGIDYLIDNLIARAKEYGLDDVVDELNDAMDKVRDARKICAECPVKGECLADALMTGDVEYGMRGGLTPRERMGILATKVAMYE